MTANSGNDRAAFWFADTREDGLWEPSIQTATQGAFALDLAFSSKEACEAFIRQHVIGVPMEGDPTW